MRTIVYALCTVLMCITSPFRMITRLSVQPSFIEHSNAPSCVNCRHFIQNDHEAYTSFPASPPKGTGLRPSPLGSNDTSYAKCAKFGKQDMVSGVITHHYASICREMPNLCREDGRYYKNASNE